MTSSAIDISSVLGIPFSPEQLEAITAPLEPAVIIAGAGSGKTTVMAARVVWLVATGQVAPAEVLGLTFTRKAAAELGARIRSALEQAGITSHDDAGEPAVMTYDAYAGLIVDECGLLLGIEGGRRLLSEAAAYRMAARSVQRYQHGLPTLSRLTPSTIVTRLLKLDGDMQSHLTTIPDVEAMSAALAREAEAVPRTKQGNIPKQVQAATSAHAERCELAGLIESFRAEKARQLSVGFADRMAEAAQLASSIPAVGAAQRSQYRIVLLDEYQDTSAAQVQFLSALFGSRAVQRGAEEGFPVTAVGDPFQGIYAWRGAAAANVVDFPQDFPRHGGMPARRYSLSVNRRSGSRILQAANALVQPVRDAEPALAASTSPLIPAEGKGEGEIYLGTYATWPDEVAATVDAVEALHRRGAAAGGVDRWSDIAMLVRANSLITDLYTALRERDIPADIVGLGGLLQLPEIMEICAVLRVLEDPAHNPSLLRMLTGARWAIGRGDLELLGARAAALARGQRAHDDDSGSSDPLGDAVMGLDPSETHSLVDALADLGPLPYSNEARQRFQQLNRELAELRRHASDHPVELVRRVIAILGLDVELAASPAAVAHRGRHQVAAFVDAVGAFCDAEDDTSLAALLAYLDAEIEQGVGLEQVVHMEADSIKLLTMHKAKGLEWDVVFLPGLSQGVFPSSQPPDNWTTTAHVLPARLRGDAASVPQLESTTVDGLTAYADDLKTQAERAERRLAYVAVTRARRQLWASCSWWAPGRKTPRAASSYFLSLLDSGTLIHEAEPATAGQNNPLITEPTATAWPASADPELRERRNNAAAAVLDAIAQPAVLAIPSTLDDAERVASWDRDMAALLAEREQTTQARHAVVMPPALSATQLLNAQRNPEHFASSLVRPMPRKPSREAEIGTRFHTWVEKQFFATTLFDLDDAEMFAYGDADSDAAVAELAEAFQRGQFADQTPLYVEFPFTLAIPVAYGVEQIRGRIDAIYRLGPEQYQVIDWKTSQSETADPLQLAIYRAAFAAIANIDPAQVVAGFYYVRTDRLVTPENLPDLGALGALLDNLVS